jgi:uncharacterized Ntn-hydrolase superfamily protein
MTFSIVGFDPANGDLGIAVASKFIAVGAVVPYAKAGVGAVATQAWANTDFGPQGLERMAAGDSAPDALAALVDADEGRDDRQAGFVDPNGVPATFTGGSCMAWAGGRTGEHVAVQGNILVGQEVVDEAFRAFEDAEGDLCDKLVAALLAGDAAGGDRRGRQGAALLVVREGGGYEGRNDRYIDLRVDDHPDAPNELARVFRVWDEFVLVRNDPTLEATPALVTELQRRLRALGRLDAQPNGVFDHATVRALDDWAGEYNLEGRLRYDGRLSRHLLMEIRDVTPEIPASEPDVDVDEPER